MDLTTARGKLRTRIGNPSTGEVPDSTLTECINIAQREIATKFKFYSSRVEGTITTASGTSDYALPSNVKVVRSVWDVTNKLKLRRAGERFNAEALTLYGTNYAKPQWYGRVGSNIRLYPTPDDVYSIKYLGKQIPTDLSADADLITLPDTWLDGLYKLARSKYYDDFAHDVTKAIDAMNSYQIWLKDQPTEIDEEMIDNDSGVVLPTLGTVAPRYDFDHSD